VNETISRAVMQLPGQSLRLEPSWSVVRWTPASPMRPGSLGCGSASALPSVRRSAETGSLTGVPFMRIAILAFVLAVMPGCHTTSPTPPRSADRIPGVATDGLQRLIPELEREVRRTMVEGDIPSLTVALVVGDSTVWAGGYGYSNLWARTPAVPETVYLIGSTYKAMSTVGLLRLMEQGRFGLDDPVGDYLGPVRIRGEIPTNPVTFRHLLTHTSGLPVTFGPHLVWGNTVPRAFPAYFEETLEVLGPPLDSLRYSNIAYTLIAYIIEELSGQEYAAYMEQQVFQPLGLTSTAFHPTPAMDERLAIPYLHDDETGHTPAPRLKADAWPAGIVYGTILDQARWLRANLNGGTLDGVTIIAPSTLDSMKTVQYDRFRGPISAGWGDGQAGWGLTWWVANRGGDRYFAHSGSVPGYTAFIEGNRDRGVGVALLSNGHAAHAHLFSLSEHIIDRVLAAIDMATDHGVAAPDS